eukprot:TRINITY_DN2363_c0_g1_i7.p1 TRINITY_DN2363_c0_g1~~TRINITY_DN2363_c0_g1_i7.p1  ORF type:complete len:244 (-),score=57.23 TRINITY_DN2363_c0_g1_i7:1016-1747(-)
MDSMHDSEPRRVEDSKSPFDKATLSSEAFSSSKKNFKIDTNVAESMKDVFLSARKPKQSPYEEFMSSRSSREWLDQQQNKKPDPNIAPADEFSLREVIQYARRIEEIDRRMDLAIGDSSERAKKARALYDHTTRLAQNQKVLTQLSRKILEKKERKLREELSKQYRPLIDEEMHRLETSSGAFEKKTRARLKKSWEKGLERRIKVEIEKKKMNEWAPEKVSLYSFERRLVFFFYFVRDTTIII